jgi:hypothetical protein
MFLKYKWHLLLRLPPPHPTKSLQLSQAAQVE